MLARVAIVTLAATTRTNLNMYRDVSSRLRNMSNSYVIEPRENGSEKKDDTLIIVVNDDGTISVDQETLQSLIGKSRLLFNSIYQHNPIY